MTELKLKDELKVRPGEGPVDYAERTKDVLKKHHEETGERLHPTGTLPDEAPGETIVRLKMLKEAGDIEAAARKRRNAERERPSGPLVISRTASQEKDVERAVSAFEAEKKRLYRDGVKLYADEEHTRRLGELTEDLREKVEAVAEEAARDAVGYEREALALSYRDPLTNLTVSERERVSASLPLVREDCETMALAALVERMRALAASTDKPSKLLHARYGLRRYEIENVQLSEARLASQGQSTDGNPVGTTDTAALRELKTAAEEIAQELKDPKITEREQALKEAAAKSRGVVGGARSKLSQANGSAERVRREHAAGLQAAF